MLVGCILILTFIIVILCIYNFFDLFKIHFLLALFSLVIAISLIILVYDIFNTTGEWERILEWIK